VHALNYDAIGPAGAHLGLAAVPAVLAAAQAAGAGEREFLVGCAVAAEVATRLAVVLETSPNRRAGTLDGQWLGYPAATAGAAKAASLDADAIHSALGLASMQFAGSMEIMRAGDVPAKAIYGAFPNGAAVRAVELAGRGLDARCDAIGGAFGLVATCAPDADLGPLLDRFGSAFRMTGVGFKPWPTTGHAHGYIEAALRARVDCPPVSGATEIVLDVAAGTEPWVEPAAARRRPPNGAAAANSLPFAVAVALVHGDVAVDHLTGAGLADPAVLGLAERVTYRVAPPGGPLRLTVGSAVFDVPAVPRALGRAEVIAKARRLLAPSFPAAAIDTLVGVISALGDNPNGGMAGLAEALAAGTPPGGSQ
jgi:2-methylcitrate dehydratase PrpD